MPQVIVKCCHCGKDVALNMQARHEAVCLHGPAGDVLRDFMRRHACNGVAMQKREYMDSAERRDLGLPDGTTLTRWFGTWADVATWCGLSYVKLTSETMREMRREQWTDVMATVDADMARSRAAERDAFDWSAMPVLKRTVKRIYNWRTYRYELCEVMELR